MNEKKKKTNIYYRKVKRRRKKTGSEQKEIDKLRRSDTINDWISKSINTSKKRSKKCETEREWKKWNFIDSSTHGNFEIFFFELHVWRWVDVYCSDDCSSTKYSRIQQSNISFYQKLFKLRDTMIICNKCSKYVKYCAHCAPHTQSWVMTTQKYSGTWINKK